jgi:hypothetical protein
MTADGDVYTRLARFAVDKTKLTPPPNKSAAVHIANEKPEGFLVRIPDGEGVPRDLLVVPISPKEPEKR